MDKKSKDANGKKGIKVYIPLILVILIVICGGWYWYDQYSKYISTDDAHVDSDNISVSSKILGRVVRVYAEEGDSVKKGKLLTELDSSDLLAQKKQNFALKDQAIANKFQSEAKYKFDEENIKVLEVNFEKAQDDFTRAKNQFAGDVITKEQFDHSKNGYESAKAVLEASKTQLMVSKAQISSAEAAIESSIAQIGVINTQLNNTKLYAPVDGIVAKRWLLPGDVIQPGQAVMTVTNNHKLWVVVYIEETKLADIHLNQKAMFEIDAFSGVTFLGKVFSIGSNTASQFSLIPPNNASGNFTKVTQRVPLKISIDGTDKSQSPSSYKILAGMSVVVKIVKEKK